MSRPIHAVFYRLGSGREPVREWLKRLEPEHRKRIGEDIKTLQFQWPLGMPLVRKMDENLWEVRTRLSSQIARVFFTVLNQKIILLHGFVKQSTRTPAKELACARRRLGTLRG